MTGWADNLAHEERPSAPAPSRVRVDGGSRYGRRALEKECSELARTPEGQRNAQLNRAAFSIGQLVAGGELAESEAAAALANAAEIAGLKKNEIVKTLDSGLRSGMAEPRTAPPREQKQQSGPRAVPTDLDTMIDSMADEGEVSTVVDSPDETLLHRGENSRAVREKSGDFLDTAGQNPKEKAKPSILDDKWVRFSEATNLLLEEPPKQRWFLEQAHRGRSVGVFPRGRAGMVTATGGVGKTYALIDLAVAQAVGGFWFGAFRCVEPGHVLLGLAEEDLDEARRRIWRVCNSREMSRDDRERVAQNIDLLPLAGVPVALTCAPAPGVISPTVFHGELLDRLRARGVDWSLIILDPLSRWAGGGVESDNEAATRFCQVVETLTKVPGNPSVVVAHHSSKTSAKDGAADARGVTGLRDGFRWQASLDPLSTEDGLQGAKLTNRKSNYSRMFDEVVLVRSEEPGAEGTLRVALDWEAESLRTGTKRLEEDDYRARVLTTIQKHPGLTSATAISERTTGKKTRVLDAVKALLNEGGIEKTDGRFAVVPGAGTDGGKK